MSDLTKTELLEKLLKLLQTDRDLNFLLSMEEDGSFYIRPRFKAAK
jgi:hypothetical protein